MVYGELSYPGRILTSGVAAADIAAFVAELRGLGWLPAWKDEILSDVRNDVTR